MNNTINRPIAKRVTTVTTITTTILIVMAFALVIQHDAFGIPASPLAFSVSQPDGSQVTLHVRGDESRHWLEDTAGFSVVRDDDLAYVYAQLGSDNELVPTAMVVGKADPQIMGIQQHLMPPAISIMQQDVTHWQGLAPTPSPLPMTDDPWTPPSGSGGGIGGSDQDGPPGPGYQAIKNLVLLVAFNDHYDSSSGVDTVKPEFGKEPEEYEDLFNGRGGNALDDPFPSVKQYYLFSSYGTADIESTIYGWIKLPENEEFYTFSGSGPAWMALHALERIQPGFDFTVFDGDGDMWLDSLTIVHSGYAGEHDGNPARIWSHAWTLPDWAGGGCCPDPVITHDGITILGYCTGPGLWGPQPEDPIDPIQTELSRFAIFCHELGHHAFGFPDIYDTDSSSEGVGNWCMMSGGSWGFDGSQLHPSHFSAWIKTKANTNELVNKWISPTSRAAWVNPVLLPDPHAVDFLGVKDINLIANDPCALYRINLVYDNLTVRSNPATLEMSEAIEAGTPQIYSTTYTGDPSAVGLFRGGIASGLPFESGVILSTGNVMHAPGPNNDDILEMLESPGGNTTTHFGTEGDTDLADSLLGTVPEDPCVPPNTADAASIEFKYTTPAGYSPVEALYVNFVFASEEYGDPADPCVISIPRDHFVILFDGAVVNSIATDYWEYGQSAPPDGSWDNWVTNPQKNIEYNGVSCLHTTHIDITLLDTDEENPFDYYAEHTLKFIIADIEDVYESGEYTLDSAVFIQVETFGSADPCGVDPNPSREYMLIENRQPLGYESNIPQGGLAIWHIDERIGLLHDALDASPNDFEGYPGQTASQSYPNTNGRDWPYNNNHYTAALLQADGLYDLEHNYNRGDDGDLYHTNGVSEINENTIPNTDNYKWGIIHSSGLSIFGINQASPAMCFLLKDNIKYGDDYDWAIPVECGDYMINDIWVDSPGCGWRYSNTPFSCDQEDPGLPYDPCCPAGGPGGDPFDPCYPSIPSSVTGFKVTGSTEGAQVSWIPSRSDPARYMLAGDCVGYTVYNQPIDPIDVWYSFVPRKEGYYTFNLCGTTESFDTTLEVFYDINAVRNGAPALACNDDAGQVEDGCLFQSRVTLRIDQLDIMHPYLIRIAGYNNETGDYELTVTETDQAINDECGNATSITEGVALQGTNYGSTPSGADPDCYDVWHTYTPAKTGMVTISLAQSEIDTVLAVFDNCDDLNQLALNDDCAEDKDACQCYDCGENDSKLYMYMEIGTEYIIRVSGSEGATGDYTLMLRESPTNNECQGAIVATDYETSSMRYTGSTIAATPSDSDQPPHYYRSSSCGGGKDMYDVWYCYTPDIEADVTVSLCYNHSPDSICSTFDTTLAIYDDCTFGNELACNDDISEVPYIPQSELTYHMDAGDTYYIRIAGYDGAQGDYVLTVSGGQGRDDMRIAAPFEYTWRLNDHTVTCLTALGGVMPYHDWTASPIEYAFATIMDQSFYDPSGDTPQNWYADDAYWTYALPFSFPYYGQSYDQVHICSNGFLDFAENTDYASLPSITGQSSSLDVNIRIAPLWADHRTTDEPGDTSDNNNDIYISQEADHVTIRWEASPWDPAKPLFPRNFAVVLFDNGNIRFDYGPGNNDLNFEGTSPLVAISAGNGTDYYVADDYVGLDSLDNANSILLTSPFLPTPMLPAGVILDPDTGCLTGTPTELGTFIANIEVTDSTTPSNTIEQLFHFYVVGPGDANANKIVDLPDFAILASYFLDEQCKSPTWCTQLDYDKDGSVGIIDLAEFAQDWLTDYGL